MDLYLIRHADAVPLGEDGVTSEEVRPLTAKGQEQAKLLASGLNARGIRLGMVLTSPLLRARQTAEGMLRAWPHPPAELRICDELAPGGKRRKLSRFLRELGSDNAALVGHEPDLGRFAAWLIASKKAHLELAKAGVAYILCNPPVRKRTGTLVWLVTPEWLASP
jgi:phosphohistidine phosphatase